RDDQTGVFITVVTTPEGDEGNAVTHLAADVKQLAVNPHRRLLPILEGRWLGDDAFAVVTQRTTDPTLAQRLSTGETFSNPRIAAILREINGLLEWARGRDIVHRGLPASHIYLEPKTDRVRVSFAIAPIRRLHHADAKDDARTIARLAMAMLTGDIDPRAYEGESLSELRPDLPQRLQEATLALLDEKSTEENPDVAAYLALIGMADPVAAGEAERERIRAEILEEQRAEREKLADERTTFERTMAEQRAAFEKETEAARLKLERERAELEAAVTKERDALQRAVAAERAALVAKQTELAQTVAQQRAEIEQAAARDREQLEALRERLRAAGEREIERKRETALEDIADTEDALDSEELAAPAFVVPMFAPLEPLSFSSDSSLMRDDDITFAPTPDEPSDVAIVGEAPVVADTAPRDRRRWILSGSVAAVLVLVGITASVLASRETPVAPRSAPTANTAPAPVVIAPVRTDSAAVGVTQPASTPAPVAPLALDSTARRTAKRWLDSLKDVHPVEIPRPRVVSEEPVERRPAPVERPRPAIVDDPFFIPGSTAPTPKRDTPTVPKPDTTVPPPR
ncbi:MAG TPA: hypothetical protein VFI52_12035, partial [Gemmatimonadaceae bacterium]|nr:hypothetical protein [Gemmatimonadaceae bacterium]